MEDFEKRLLDTSDREPLLDFAELRLLKLMELDNPTGFNAIKLVLQMLGAERGWAGAGSGISEKELEMLRNIVQATLARFVPADKLSEAQAYFIDQIKTSLDNAAEVSGSTGREEG